MNDFLRHRIDPSEFPSAKDISLIAIELSKAPRNGICTLNEQSVEAALDLWLTSHKVLQDYAVNHQNLNHFITKYGNNVPLWPDEQATRITYHQFRSLFLDILSVPKMNDLTKKQKGNQLSAKFDEIMKCFFFFQSMPQDPSWFDRAILNEQTIGIQFSKERCVVKFKDFVTLLEKNKITPEFKNIYKIYLFTEAQKLDKSIHFIQDPKTLDFKVLNSCAMEAAESHFTDFMENEVHKIYFAQLATQVYIFAKFYDDIDKHLVSSSKTAKKQK